MRRGFGLPHSGKAASGDAIAKVAKRAEELGYDSLWVYERFLYPVNPQTPYVGSSDGSYQEPFGTVLDTIETLTWAATDTRDIEIGPTVSERSNYNTCC